uniref:Uncharacterized protein n=1 Tax=Arundo donax TaxID=35708 RepID=A0A0A9B6P1_ARUDO
MESLRSQDISKNNICICERIKEINEKKKCFLLNNLQANWYCKMFSLISWFIEYSGIFMTVFKVQGSIYMALIAQ